MARYRELRDKGARYLLIALDWGSVNSPPDWDGGQVGRQERGWWEWVMDFGPAKDDVKF